MFDSTDSIPAENTRAPAPSKARRNHGRLNRASVVAFIFAALAFVACAMGVFGSDHPTGTLAILDTAAVGFICLVIGIWAFKGTSVDDVLAEARDRPAAAETQSVDLVTQQAGLRADSGARSEPGVLR